VTRRVSVGSVRRAERRRTLLEAAARIDAVADSYARDARDPTPEIRRTSAIAAATSRGIAAAMRRDAER